MTFMSVTASTRRAKPLHEPWTPHAYQRRSVEHLTSRHSAGLALDPGLGKTSIVLEAFRQLKARGMARTMLVVAPLRVCRTVWRQEGQKWTQFRDLRFSLLHGAKKAERLKDDADIWLINPEGAAWLAKEFWGRPLPWDVIVIDELTKFKNARAERSKVLRPRMSKARYRWGLTGSLAPNGYMDLFGQQLMLDDGAALGKYITHYRDQYFQVDFNGFDYTLQPGAEKRIITKLAPYWLQMSADDYLELPQLVEDIRLIELEPDARKTYEKMKKDMLAELPEGVVTGANAGAVYSKLAQMANGAVYLNDARDVAAIHDTKLDALEELIEELQGQPLLVAYEFNHDRARLCSRFGDLPCLGKGTTPAEERDYIARWNRNEIPVLLAHPASAGHGLNLQEGSAAHVCWFSTTWDLELYDQFIRRVRRQGNDAQRIFNHLLMARGTIDELKLEALRDKDVTQSRLLRSLNTEILRDAESTKETTMSVAKLSRQADGAAPARGFTPKGWGAPAAAPAPQPAAEPATQTAPTPMRAPKRWPGAGEPTPAASTAETEQRERIAAQLTGAPLGGGALVAPAEDSGPSPAERARAMFSKGVQQARETLEQGETPAAAQQVVQTAAPEAPTAAEPVKPTRRRQTVEKPAAEAPGEGTPHLTVQPVKVDYDILARHVLKHFLQGVVASL